MYDTALESPPGSLATFDSNSLNTSLAFANPITQVHSHQPPDVAPLIQPKLKVTQPHPAKPAQPHLLGRRSLQQLMPSSSTTTPASDRLPPQLLDLTQSTISSSSHASTATHLTQLPLHPQPSVPHLHLQPSAVPASDSSETVTPAGTIVNVALASLSTAEQQQEIELLRQEVQNVLLQTAMERKEFQRKEQEHRERTRRMQEEINRTNDKVMFLTSKHQSFLPKDAADDALAGPDRPQPSTSTSHQRAARPRSNSQHSQSLSRSNSKHSQHLSLSPAAALQKQPHASPAVSATFERPQSSRDRQRPHAEDDTPPSGSISRQSSGRRSRSSASGSLRAPPSHVHGPSFQHTPNLQPKPAPRRLRSKSTEPPLRPHPMEQAVHLQQRPMARPRSNSGGLVFPAGAMRSQSVGDYEYFYSDPPHRPDFDTSDPESSVLDEEDDDLDDDGTMDDESEEMEDQDYLNRMYYTHHAPPHGMLPPRSSSQQRQRQPRSSPFHYDTSFPPRRMRQPGRHHPPPLHMHHGMPMLPPYLSPRYMHPSDSPAYHPVPRSRPSSRHDMAPPPPFAYDPAMSFYPMMPPGRGRRRPSPVIPHDPLDNDYGRQRHPQPIPTYRHWHPDDY
ncbi:hypothetical protein DM01DRAFT_1332720 [Hesseltinella vesiculosa]|uniref:Uncharacterized protein n=1 Tax=Hesseltinella vesiculosa TaxID=101127 RepID=A0A1X2GU97_9FUNG|nr:hypothetical protein DM01DRAFT_1332720 [Hesseltinella vesiculosa]